MILAFWSLCTYEPYHHYDGNHTDERGWDCGSCGSCPARTVFFTEVSNMGLVLLIILIVLLLGGLPTWGYHSYGYGPSGILGVLLIIVIVLLLTGRV